MIWRLVVCLLWLVPSGVAAQDIRLPGNAVEQVNLSTAPDSYRIATGPWDGTLPVLMAEGVVTKTAWRISGAGLTTLQVLRPLREQIAQAGFQPIYSCEAETCGGFDFRFAIDVLPPPAMQVDIGDFRYLSAKKETPDGVFFFSLLVSRTGEGSYVQVVQISPETATAAIVESAGRALRPTSDLTADLTAAPANLTEALDTIGRAVLEDLAFATGSAQLTDAPSASLRELAEYLLSQPDLTVALVGHTDSSGSLDGNISLSKRRAGSVLERLATEYAVPRRQLEAQGMGYLAPIANNRSEEGREKNRRVEVIITSIE